MAICQSGRRKSLVNLAGLALRFGPSSPETCSRFGRPDAMSRPAAAAGVPRRGSRLWVRAADGGRCRPIALTFQVGRRRILATSLSRLPYAFLKNPIFKVGLLSQSCTAARRVLECRQFAICMGKERWIPYIWLLHLFCVPRRCAARTATFTTRRCSTHPMTVMEASGAVGNALDANSDSAPMNALSYRRR